MSNKVLSRMLAGTAGKTALPLFGLLLTSLLTESFPRMEAYESVEYGFSFLASLGAAGCLVFLIVHIYRCGGLPRFHRSVIFTRGIPAVASTSHGERWPLLVGLLFGQFFVLLAGLGGWVEARGRSRGNLTA